MVVSLEVCFRAWATIGGRHWRIKEQAEHGAKMKSIDDMHVFGTLRIAL
jgi:hypothetical protein